MVVKEKNNLFLLTIVAIVAIVAIVILIATAGSRTDYLSQDTTSPEDNAGQATRGTASTELDARGRTSDPYQSPGPVQKSYCSDSDDGKDYENQGAVTYSDKDSEKSKSDYCKGYNSATLVEQYCEKNKPASVDYKCPFGCADGKCNAFDDYASWTSWIDRDNPSGMADFEHKMDSPEVCAEPIAVECVRTDGVDYITAGQDVFCNRDVGVICYNALNPEGCYDYKVRYLCPKTDFTGRESRFKCIETDSGRDIYNKGFTTGVTFEGDRIQEQKLMDHCQTPTDLNLLVEYYCGDDGYVHEELAINCPNGCFDGACKPELPVCGNSICEIGEATNCPVCTSQPCPMMACKLGTCPQDCSLDTLSVYPEFLFDADKKFVGQIVIGRTAPASDVIIALDIAAALFRTNDTGNITPIAVGVAVLDTEASHTKPSLIINGPCVNLLAAWHLNNPINCAAGYESGIGRLDFLKKEGQSAVMVSGYTAQDIKNAKTVLVNWANYEQDLGDAKSVCIKGISTNEISVYKCDSLGSEPVTECVDSDGGIDIYTKGQSTGPNANGGIETIYDSCMERYPTEGMRQVKSCTGELCAQEETFCDGGHIAWYSPQGRGSDCPYGCIDGACLRPSYDLVDQTISLNTGWNYISLNVNPGSLDIEYLMSPLVEEGSLELVKNNAGQVYWPEQGIHDLKNIRLEEGYMIKVRQNTQLIIRGEKVSLPFIVPLNTGWNLAPYPAQDTAPAMDVISDLKDSGVLVKVQDEAGNAIENLPGIGWIDNIKEFNPGEGYMINVNQEAKLIVKNYGYYKYLILEDIGEYKYDPNSLYYGSEGNPPYYFNYYQVGYTEDVTSRNADAAVALFSSREDALGFLSLAMSESGLWQIKNIDGKNIYYMGDSNSQTLVWTEGSKLIVIEQKAYRYKVPTISTESVNNIITGNAIATAEEAIIEEYPAGYYVSPVAYAYLNKYPSDLPVSTEPYCGNGIQDPGEQCDGNVWAHGATCEYFGYTGGTLSCTSECTFDFSGCMMPPINQCTDSDDGLNYYTYGHVTEGQAVHPDSCEDFEQSYFAVASCADDEIAIGGMGGCNAGGSTNHQIAPSITTWSNAGAMYGGEAHDWQVGCKGYGSAAIEAICVKDTDLQYRLSSIGQSQQYTDDKQDYYAEAYCADDEIAIGGMGGCNEMGTSYARPSMTFSNWIQRNSNEAKGWQIGCQGPGSAIVQALCVKKTDLQYTISPLGQKQHYINDEESYYAEAYCADDEIAIGGQGGCNEMSPSSLRPSMTNFNWIQRNSNEAKGWQIGCKGPGTAVVEALCVKKTDLQYTISPLGQKQHYVEDGLLNEGTCNNYKYTNNKYVCPNGCQDGACVANNMADLAVDKIIIDSTDILDSQGRYQVNINAIIKNIGNMKSDSFDVVLYVDGVSHSSGNGYQGLNPGQTVGPFNVGGGSYYEAGPHIAKFEIRPYGVDGNSYNNVLEEKFYVGPASGYCGDGILQAREECDGNDLRGIQCTDLNGFTGGELTCFPPGHQNECSWNIMNCVELNVYATLSPTINTDNAQRTVEISYTASQNLANYLRYIDAIQLNSDARVNVMRDSTTLIGTSGKYVWTVPSYLPEGEYVIEVGAQPQGYGVSAQSKGFTISNGVGYCGDGILQAGEECEPNNPLMASCVDFSDFTGGDLRCSEDCRYDISGCVHNPTISIGLYPMPFVKQGGQGPNGKFVIGVYSSPEDSSAMLILSQDIKIRNFATMPLEYDVDTVMPATDNMIVVGGACANTIAANLLGNPYDCTLGLQPGQSRIKLVATGGGYYALLVYGYTASDTANAAYVLTHRQDFSDVLTGATQICISGSAGNLNVVRC